MARHVCTFAVAQRKRMYYNDVTKYKQKKMKNSCVFARGF